MRRFRDDAGTPWEAYVNEREGDDYKGRFWFVMVPEGGAEGDAVELVDVRWNSKKTAERTLRTMSEWELRRRLRSALGRAA
jgi:hypothetical protein